VETTHKMLGWYYLWGGRSSFSPDLWNSQTQITGVDCSGLVTLAYKTAGLVLPRDSGPLFATSTNVTHPSRLRAGDLFFFADVNHLTKIHHVMMYIGDNHLAESNFDTDMGARNNNGTRIIHVREKFGVETVGDLMWGMVADKDSDVLYWGAVAEN